MGHGFETGVAHFTFAATAKELPSYRIQAHTRRKPVFTRGGHASLGDGDQCARPPLVRAQIDEAGNSAWVDARAEEACF